MTREYPYSIPHHVDIIIALSVSSLPLDKIIRPKRWSKKL